MTSSRTMRCSAGLVALLLCLSGTLGACSSQGSPESKVQTLEDAPGDVPVAEDDPRQLAAPDQLELLKGELSFEKYQEAVGRTIQCMRDSGIDVINTDVSERRGYPEIAYSFSASSPGRSDTQTKAVADDCTYKHSFLVEQKYQTSPRALEAMDAQFNPYKAAIVECIESNGGDVDGSAGREDILMAAYDVQADNGHDCLAESGLPQ